MKIQGRKVWLAPFTESHLLDPKYIEWLRDMEVVRWIGREEYLKPIPFERVREYVEGIWASQECSFFAVHDSMNDEFIGTSKLNYVNPAGIAARTADVGIMIGDRTRWGKGIATDALHALSRHAFDVLAARKLTAGAAEPNVAVLRAFNRIGFREEARLRQKLLIGGEYYDHVLLGCFPNELVDGG